MRMIKLAAAAVVLFGATAATANQGVEDRKELMQSIVKNVKAIGGVVKGESQETAADVSRRASEIKAAAADIEGAFGDRVHVQNAGDVKTTASPAIWPQWAKFVEIANDLEARAGELASAADGGDMDAIKGGFSAMTKTCGACHKPFRIKKN